MLLRHFHHSCRKYITLVCHIVTDMKIFFTSLFRELARQRRSKAAYAGACLPLARR
jgi:hypothetical protein